MKLPSDLIVAIMPPGRDGGFYQAEMDNMVVTMPPQHAHSELLNEKNCCSYLLMRSRTYPPGIDKE